MTLTAADIQDMAIDVEKTDGPGQGAHVLKTFWPHLTAHAIDCILTRKLILSSGNKVRIARSAPRA